MPTPSWSFNNGVISDAGNPGWSYDLNKQKGSFQNTDQALQGAMRDWQTQNVPGGWNNGVANSAALNPTSAALTAARQSIGGAAGTWGQDQTWNTAGNPMASRPDVAPSTQGGQPLNQIGIANTAPLNQWGQPQGTPHNALTGGAPPTVAQKQGSDWGNSSGTQAGVKITPGTGQTFQPSAQGQKATNTLTGGSQPAAGQGGTTPQQANLGTNTAGPGTPATGPGAGRGYPSNWNANNAPGLNGDTTFATNPETGASYEVSPMYQFQQKAGEKSINRALRARGRYNSSVGVNALANFNNQLGAQEANQQYNRVFQQQQLGLQAALAQAQSQGASSAQLAQLYAQLGGQMGQGSNQYGVNIADLLHNYGLAQTQNMLSQGSQLGQNAWLRAGEQIPVNTQSGQITNDMIQQAIAAGLKGWEGYKNKPQ